MISRRNNVVRSMLGGYQSITSTKMSLKCDQEQKADGSERSTGIWGISRSLQFLYKMNLSGTQTKLENLTLTATFAFILLST
jgi:hypothetical protein